MKRLCLLVAGQGRMRAMDTKKKQLESVRSHGSHWLKDLASGGVPSV